jgi:hypothetical protein
LELNRLDVGDHVAVQGALSASVFNGKNGPAVSLSVVADHVIAARQPPKARAHKPKTQSEDRPADRQFSRDQGRAFDNDIGF